MSAADLTLRPETDPLELIHLRDGIYAADLLIAAVAWLDFFTWLSLHPSNKAQISRSLGVAERPLDVMLTLFAAMGLIQGSEENDGPYRLTELAREHLVRGSPWDLGPYYSSLKQRPGCRELFEVLRTGRPAKWSSQEEGEDWAASLGDEGFARSFNAAMDSRGACLGPAMADVFPCADHQRLLDIAGGSGIYSCCLVARHPQLRAAVLEKPPADRWTRLLIEDRGFADRISVSGADMFVDPFPSGFDMHLFSHVLHDWDVPEVRQLLSKSFASLPPGGMVAIHDTHIDADKTGPLAVAQYSVLLMHSTEGKCYSVREMEAFLNDAGFASVEVVPTAAHRSLMTARKPVRPA